MRISPQESFDAVKALIEAGTHTFEELEQILEERQAALLTPTALAYLYDLATQHQRAGHTEDSQLLQTHLQLLQAVKRDGLANAWQQFQASSNPVTEYLRAVEIRVHFLQTENPDETFLYLREKRWALLTEKSIAWIKEWVRLLAHYDEPKPPLGGEANSLWDAADWVAKLRSPESLKAQRLLDLLIDATAYGIDAAWERYCHLLQQEEQARKVDFSKEEELFWVAWDLKLDVPNRLLRDFHGAIPTDPEVLFKHAWRFRRPFDSPYKIELLTRALEGVNRETNPKLYAEILYHRGLSYYMSSVGDTAQNQENAIADYQAAQATASRPFLQMAISKQLAAVYHERHHGDPKENVKEALKAINKALALYPREKDPYIWIGLLIDRALISDDLLMDNPEEAIESALADYATVLSVLTLHPYAFSWARVLVNRAGTYALRIKGERRQNWELALADLEAALTVEKEEDPGWASIHQTRGAILAFFDEREKLEEAISEYGLALSYYSWPASPFKQLTLLMGRAHTFMKLGRWHEAHQDYVLAREIQREALEHAVTESSRAALIAVRAKQDIYLRDAEALLHLEGTEWLAQMTVILESGRAQRLRVALDLDTLSLERTALRPEAKTSVEMVRKARESWRAAQLALADESSNSPYKAGLLQQVHKAHEEFESARDAYRQFDPSFLAPSSTLDDIARSISDPDEAIVYLAAGEQIGFALMVTRSPHKGPQVAALALPHLQADNIDSLLWTVEEGSSWSTFPDDGLTILLPPEDALVGGFMLAQTNGGFGCVQRRGISADLALHSLPSESGLALALKQLEKDPVLSPLFDIPFSELLPHERQILARRFNIRLKSIELRRAMRLLGEWGLSEVAERLYAGGIRKVALIPYGRLGLFPLPSVFVTSQTPGERTLGELFEVTLAPNARAWETAKQRRDALDREKRQILAVGNPLPLPQGIRELGAATTEAQTIQRIATSFACGSICCLTQYEGKKQQVKEGLNKAWLAHLALHGIYDQQNPYRSRLILAGDSTIPEAERTLTLEECLRGEISLNGLRLLVLSACETSIIDVRRAANEVVGLAAGFLQAGAAGVIASLWPVDDRATYFLMARFMQLYLDPARQAWSPARCLAEAQRWLREEATKETLAAYDPTSQVPLSPLPSFSRAATHSLSQQETALPYADPIYWAAFTVTGC